MPRFRFPRDPVLLAALAASFALCLHGITATILHPDQMALRPLFLPDRPPFDPGWFEKPPGYSYLNWLLAVVPVGTIGRLTGATAAATVDATIVWSRIVAAAMLLATVVLTYDVALRAFGRPAARTTALLLATGAGMIAFVHQLTADVPVTLAMLVALRAALAIPAHGRLRDYLGAGLATGVATAIKYNGLGVGIALVVAHAFRVLGVRGASGTTPLSSTWRRLLLDRALWLGLAAVPVGFVLLNPYALLDFRTFWADFRYNALVAPVYEGQSGRSYGAFFLRMTEVVGVPATAATLAGAAAAVALAARRRRCDGGAAALWTTLAVVALYYATFARFPRLETRFVLPIVPFVLLLAGPAWARLRAASAPALALLVGLLIAYDVVCCAWVGRRFLDDPRFGAATWLAANVAPASRVEVDEYSPGEKVAARTGFALTAMPFVTGRERLFQQVFAGDAFVNGSEQRQRELEAPIAWYTIAALAARAPDYVVVNSLYYDRFLQPGPRRDLYPSLVEFFTALLGETAGYRIAFDARSPSVPPWVYPRDVDFLDNRATVLQRAGDAGRARK